MPVDLHLHSPASDGTDSVPDRVNQANRYGLDKIALTDHDCISEELEGRTRYIDGVEVVTGAEIKCEVDGTGIEILGYFLDPSDQEINRLFDELERNRIERIETMIERVNTGENLDLSFEEVAQNGEGTVGRPHLADALIDEGVTEDMDEAFQEYIGEDSPTDYYVETEKIGAGRVIETIKENGGATSLAHPGRNLETENAGEIVESLVSKGLDAIEVPYTYQHKRQEDYGINFGIRKAYDLAKQNNILITGGSDCHGEESGKYNIGKIKLENTYLEHLRKKAQNRQ